VEGEKPAVKNFVERLHWIINETGDHVLVKKEERTKEDASVEATVNNEINAYYSEYDKKQDYMNNLYSGQWVFSEFGKHEILEINDGLIKLKTEGEPISIVSTEVRKEAGIIVTVISDKGVFPFGKISFDINMDYSGITNCISLLTELPTKFLRFFLRKTKEELTSDFHLYSLDFAEEQGIDVFVKELTTTCLTRTPYNSYSWSDKKFIIGLKTPTTIRINAVGFYRNYNSAPVTYEFYVYEEDTDLNRVLKSSLTDIVVTTDSVSSSTQTKKVSVPPFIATPDKKYIFMISYGADCSSTYYGYSGSESMTSEDGLVFKFSRENEEGYRSDTGSGHIGQIYYEICSSFA
jgi:hypothetical protein